MDLQLLGLLSCVIGALLMVAHIAQHQKKCRRRTRPPDAQLLALLRERQRYQMSDW